MAQKNKNTIILVIAALVVIVLFLKSNNMLSFLEYGATYDYNYEPFLVMDFTSSADGRGSCITYNLTTNCASACALYNNINDGKWGNNYAYTSLETYRCNGTVNSGSKNPIVLEAGGNLTLTTNLSGGNGFKGTTIYSNKNFIGYDTIISLTTNCDSRTANYTAGGCSGAVRFGPNMPRRMIPQTARTTDVIYEIRWNLSSLSGTDKQYAIFENGQLIYHNSTTSSSFYFGFAAYQELYGPTPGYATVNYLKYKKTGDTYPGYYFSDNNCSFMKITTEDTTPYNTTFLQSYEECTALIQPTSYPGYRFSDNTCTAATVTSTTSPYNFSFLQSQTACQSLIDTRVGNRTRTIALPNYVLPAGSSKDFQVVFDVERLNACDSAKFQINLLAKEIGGSRSLGKNYTFRVNTTCTS